MTILLIICLGTLLVLWIMPRIKPRTVSKKYGFIRVQYKGYSPKKATTRLPFRRQIVWFHKKNPPAPRTTRRDGR